MGMRQSKASKELMARRQELADRFSKWRSTKVAEWEDTREKRMELRGGVDTRITRARRTRRRRWSSLLKRRPLSCRSLEQTRAAVRTAWHHSWLSSCWQLTLLRIYDEYITLHVFD